MDTPLDKRTTKSLVDGSVYHLVSYDLVHNLNCRVSFVCFGFGFYADCF